MLTRRSFLRTTGGRGGRGGDIHGQGLARVQAAGRRLDSRPGQAGGDAAADETTGARSSRRSRSTGRSSTSITAAAARARVSFTTR